MSNKGLAVIGIIFIAVGLLCLGAAFGLSFLPLSLVSYEGPIGKVTIADVSMPVATALWVGIVLILIGVGCLGVSGRH